MPQSYFIIDLVDPLLAYASITLFALSAVLAMRDARHIVQGRLLALVMVTQLFLAIAALPAVQFLPPSLTIIARALALPNVGLLWWFCLSLLRDDFKPGRLEWGGLLALLIVPALYFIERFGSALPFNDWVNSLGDLPPLAMVAHVVWVAISERDADLIEPRRRARLVLAFAPLAALLVSLFAESMQSDPMASIVRNGLGMLPAQILIFFWLVNMGAERLLFTSHPQPQAPQIDPRDVALHRKLMAAMVEDRAYLRQGLTIDELADMLKVPPHQLRHLINTGLGFRNFPSFLNGFRLAHAKSALADDERARDTVLAIAYESGFASLPSFNRVFKDAEGQTPSAFRTGALVRLAAEKKSVMQN